ncbi:MAG: (deoxy)nucleoside triphosphate pyrophosphohydrolase [Eubacteriales bacterium]|jgi:8-oxo-dGTP diphosphatase|nr:(deoxy)nucleoside triphosphate pyrophosphohydrolase [Eubacteriales bacterium]
MKSLEVAAGILVRDGKILCAQRGKGKFDYISYKYEFPGGKLEALESPMEALRRELIEEMDVVIDERNIELFCVVLHQYPDFFVKMHCFICRDFSGNVVLKEHNDIKWLEPEQLGQLDWAQADLPIVEKLIQKGI